MIGNMDKPRRAVVLGAGLAGLRGADVLSDAGVKVVVIEKDSMAGGLARTVSRNGFHFDLGPHRFHTENPSILEFVDSILPDGLMELERLSRIRLLDRYFRYPLSFPDVLSKMPLHRSVGMVFSYFTERVKGLSGGAEALDFKSWVTGRFGRKLYDLYFGPYTEKLWGCPPEELSADWASQRITVPKLTDLAKATILPGRNSSRSLVSCFHYPPGGIGRISNALARRIERRGGSIEYSSRPDSIKAADGGGYRISVNGSELMVDAILSSIPVTDYALLLGDLLPEQVRSFASCLRFRAIMFVVLRLNRTIPARDHWIYIPEGKYRFNRISFPGNFDSESDLEGTQLVFEYTCETGDDVWSGGTDLAESAILGGEALGLFSREDVVDSTSTGYAHAYPVYSLDFSRNLEPVLDSMDRLKRSVTCGRQGLFRYNNMDHSLEMGEYAALELLGRGSLRSRFRWNSDTWADG